MNTSMKTRIRKEFVNGERSYLVQRLRWTDVIRCKNEADAQEAANFIKNPIIEVDDSQDPEAATFGDLDGQNVGRDEQRFGNFIGVSCEHLPHNKNSKHLNHEGRPPCIS